MCVSLATLSVDLLTLKLVCESHLSWGIFFADLDTLGFWVLELFDMYATYGQTDGQIDRRIKAMLIAPFLLSGA